ncbi:MAG: hypothetical protein K5776_07870 [Lachnospiraceae bacterium]|nr:hypothetical protein [Lachnospiraceae bacterium]
MIRMIKNYHAFYPKKNFLLTYILFPVLLIALLNLITHVFIRNPQPESFTAIRSAISIMVPTYFMTAVIICDRFALGAIQTKKGLVSEYVKSSAGGKKLVTDVLAWDIFTRLFLAAALFAGLFLAIYKFMPEDSMVNILLRAFLGIVSAHMATTINVFFSRKIDNLFLFLIVTYFSITVLIPYAVLVTLGAENFILMITAGILLIIDAVFSILSVTGMKKTINKYWYSDNSQKGNDDDN